MVLLEEIQANNVEAEQCRADIAANEACRRDIQAKIEKAIDTNSNVNFLKILSTFRIQASGCWCFHRAAICTCLFSACFTVLSFPVPTSATAYGVDR